MAHQNNFNRILDRLYFRRTNWLRHALIKGKPGPQLTFTKSQREKRIGELQEIASKALGKKLAKKAFKNFELRKKTWRSKGWGTERKRQIFRAWTRKKLPTGRGKIYVFWAKRRCRYVGRTIGRGYRTSHHFDREWFEGITRIDVFFTRKSKALPLLECLAMHRFHPTENKFKAAKVKWTPRCPLCKIHKKIRKELRQIYNFR